MSSNTSSGRSLLGWPNEAGDASRLDELLSELSRAPVNPAGFSFTGLTDLTRLPASPIFDARPLLAATQVGGTPAALSPMAARKPRRAAPAIRKYAPMQEFATFWTAAGIPTDPLFTQQWHLNNTGQTGGAAGVDLNILPVWHLGFTGKGVRVGVFDTAMDVNHTDLAANIDLSLVINQVPDGSFVDPTVVTPIDDHATSVAGIIAAARNGTGAVGVAYDAKITPVNILGVEDGDYTWEALWQAYKFDVTNHSWGFVEPFCVSPTDAGAQYWVLQGFDTAASVGRDGLGTIQNLAAGNYRQYRMTTELTGVTVNRHVNVIGAVDYNGMVSYYSNPGASLLVVAPSSSVGAGSGITTDDVTGALGYSSGDFTSSFGGTSAATPEISGVVAAMLEANPGLGWRDVQTILAITAKHVGSAMNGAPAGYESDRWTFNAASNWNGGGLHYSNDYGFGLVDAFAAVEVAKTWAVVMPSAQTSANELSASKALTGSWNIGGGKTNVLSFSINQHINVEAMTLDFPTLNFARANDLAVTLTSPNGTSSSLLSYNGGYGASIYGGWELMTREFLNQDACGTWKVTITNNNRRDTGTLKSVKLTAYGGSTSAGSTFFYTDEFAQYWTSARGMLSYTDGYASIDAAATTGGMTMNLLTRQGTLDGKSLKIAANTNVTKIIAGDGAANIIGNNLGNTLIGGLSNDVLIGGTGNDLLDGGAGMNTLTLGAGADRVTLHTSGLAYLTDFTPGVDQLALSRSEFAALADSGINDSTFVTGSAETTRVTATGGGLVFDASTSTLYADSGLQSAPLQALARFTNHASVTARDFLFA